MTERDLKSDFSSQYTSTVFDTESRRRKAEKVLAILRDDPGELHGRLVLELGCSVGNSTIWYGKSFDRVVAVDVDRPAVARAKRENPAENIFYCIMNGESILRRARRSMSSSARTSTSACQRRARS